MSSLVGFIPSPTTGVWNIGAFPIRAYALCILLGIVAAIYIADRRYQARGGKPSTIIEVAIWAVPFGIVAARLYHLTTDFSTYFGPNGRGFLAALEIWNGGLGIWGAVAGGALGAWIACRRQGILLPPLADALAPGLAVAQALGRFGNYFNQELFGSPTTLPWGLEISPANRPPGYEQFETFHPTFLYESLWCLLAAVFIVWADRRFKLGHGRVFALYVFVYCLGRLCFELVRIDNATLVFGIRINVFTSILVALGALIYFIISAKKRPGREEILTRDPQPQDSDAADASVTEGAEKTQDSTESGTDSAQPQTTPAAPPGSDEQS